MCVNNVDATEYRILVWTDCSFVCYYFCAFVLTLRYGVLMNCGTELTGKKKPELHFLRRATTNK